MSPPRSSRGTKSAPAAKAAKTRTPASRSASSPGLWDEYHTLLAISFGAIVLGASMLGYLYFVTYGGQMKPVGGAADNSPAISRTVA